MTEITINGKRYSYPDKWADLTLADAMRISEVELPDVDDAFAWFEHTDKVIDLTAIVTKAKRDDLVNVKPEALVWMFVDKLLPMVQDIKSDKPQTYMPKLISKFEHEGRTYHMPASLQIGENVVLQHGQKVKPFIEASNLLAQYSKMRTAGITVMPLFIASIVKEKPDEVYSEAVVAKRAEAFKTLPMDVFWEVFFCILELTYRQMKDTLLYIEDQRARPKWGTQAYLDMKRGQLAQQKQALRAILKRST